MILLNAKGFGRFFFPAAVVLLALVMAPDAEARMGHTVFEGAPSEDQCRQCHEDSTNLPHPKLQVANSSFHHARIGQPIVSLAEGSHDTVAPGDTSTGEYQCTSCHSVHNPETQQFEMLFTKDCLACHSATSVTGSPGMGTNVHHYTDTFRSRDCNSCHSFLSTDSSTDSGMGGSRMGRR